MHSVTDCHECKHARGFTSIEGIDCVDCSKMGLDTVCPPDVFCEDYEKKGE